MSPDDGGSEELDSPVDLSAQIEQDLQAINAAVSSLENTDDPGPTTDALLVRATAIRAHLSLLKAHMAAAAVVVTVESTDPDYAELKRIGDLLDTSIRNSALVSTAVEDITTLLNGINSSFQIAQKLTHPNG